MLIQCPSCDANGTDDLSVCTSCGFVATQIEGFEAWAPELASGSYGEFFDPEKFKQLATFENANFWFQARNKLILWALKNYFGSPTRFAEIGCGTGFVLDAVKKALPDSEVVGTELFVKGLKFAEQRCGQVKLVQLDARKIPFRQYFDVIGIFDVLEHIEEDTVVLAQIAKALLPGGGLLITVPQHKWLWSPVDEAACHVRRYSDSELQSKVVAAGFEIVHNTSFVSFLLPAMLCARLGPRRHLVDSVTELGLNKYLNWMFGCVMAAECLLIRCGVDFAVGGSRLLVARKIVDDPFQ